MVSEIFSKLGEIAQGFATLLVNLFNAVVTIFYTAPVGTEGETGYIPGGLTIVGILALVALGTSLTIWAFNYIKRLITRVRTNA